MGTGRFESRLSVQCLSTLTSFPHLPSDESVRRLHGLWKPSCFIMCRVGTGTRRRASERNGDVFMSTDMFDLSAAQIVNAPDVRQWPMTAALTQISFDGSMTRVAFTKKNGPGRWPDITPKGWDGPLQYTLWLFLQIDGHWVGSGFIQFWNGREGSGSP